MSSHVEASRGSACRAVIASSSPKGVRREGYAAASLETYVPEMIAESMVIAMTRASWSELWLLMLMFKSMAARVRPDMSGWATEDTICKLLAQRQATTPLGVAWIHVWGSALCHSRKDPGWAYQQRYPRALPELLTAIAELTRHQPHNAPMLHSARTVQQVTHAEFHTLEVLGFELATPTPTACVEIFGRRLSLGRTTALTAAAPEPPRGATNSALNAETHVQNCTVSAHSTAGSSAWLISTVFWVWLSIMATR